jgi:hypothetical protein
MNILVDASRQKGLTPEQDGGALDVASEVSPDDLKQRDNSEFQ